MKVILVEKGILGENPGGQTPNRWIGLGSLTDFRCFHFGTLVHIVHHEIEPNSCQ